MNKKLATFVASATLLVLPIVAFAVLPISTQPTPNPTLSINGLIDAIINLIWPLFMGFAVIMFLIAGFQFLTAQGAPDKVDSARQNILWGVVGVAMGVLAFSLPYVVRTTINLG